MRVRLGRFRPAVFTKWVRPQSTYTAAVCKSYNNPLTLETVERPLLKPNQLRIAIHNCGINSLDLLNIRGESINGPKTPFIPGYEICGEILEGGDVGQRVLSLMVDTHCGGFAEEVVIAKEDSFPVDMSVPFLVGASLINSYATALLALTRRGDVEEGQYLLVTGAAGRLGLAIVDLAANVYKCKVIAMTGSEDKSSLVRERGAWATVTYGKQDLLQQVRSVMDSEEGVSLIIDSVGGEVFAEAIKCLAPEGKLIVAGFASNKIPHIDSNLILEKGYSILGVNLEQYKLKMNSIYRSAVMDVIEMCTEGLIKPIQPTIYPLEQINEAVEDLRLGASLSKVVLGVR